MVKVSLWKYLCPFYYSPGENHVLDGLEKWKHTSLEQATWFISPDELNAETLYLVCGALKSLIPRKCDNISDACLKKTALINCKGQP